MTASTVKSTKVTNLLDTSPRTLDPTRKGGGYLQVAVDTIEAAATSLDEANDVILMCPLPSNAAPISIKVYNDDLDGATDSSIDIGLFNGAVEFRDATDGLFTAYEVIDADCFATAVTALRAAVTSGTEVRHENSPTTGDIANAGSRLWEIAGLDADPNVHFVIGITSKAAAASAQAGTLTLVVEYVI